MVHIPYWLRFGNAFANASCIHLKWKLNECEFLCIGIAAFSFHPFNRSSIGWRNENKYRMVLKIVKNATECPRLICTTSSCPHIHVAFDVASAVRSSSQLALTSNITWEQLSATDRQYIITRALAWIIVRVKIHRNRFYFPFACGWQEIRHTWRVLVFITLIIISTPRSKEWVSWTELAIHATTLSHRHRAYFNTKLVWLNSAFSQEQISFNKCPHKLFPFWFGQSACTSEIPAQFILHFVWVEWLKIQNYIGNHLDVRSFGLCPSTPMHNSSAKISSTKWILKHQRASAGQLASGSIRRTDGSLNACHKH